MTKKKKSGGKRLTAQELQIEILKFLLGHPKKSFAPRQITDHLRIENNRDSAEHALNQLVQAGSVAQFAENKFGIALNRLTLDDGQETMDHGLKTKDFGLETLNKSHKKEDSSRTKTSTDQRSSSFGRPSADKSSRKIVEGRVDMTRTGAAYIVSELMDTDVYVPPKYVNGALNGDTVRVQLFAPAPYRGGRRGASQTQRKPEGEVLEVIKRANEFFIGTLRLNRKYALFLPDNPNVPTDIFVHIEDIGEAQDGDKVVIKVTDWQEGKGRVPIGKVTQTLGKIGGNDFEMKKILINAGFQLAHSEEAEREAARIPDTISPQEIERRRDFRDILTFTIDPEDAKDFDDALSVRQLDPEQSGGNIEIGVHIADVTHYLKPDSALDREAFERSTSVYLVDRCNPMLPEKLSNNLCSLVPEQDRLTFSAVFVFDSKDKIVSRWFGKTVIHSAKRFAYEEAQTILDKKASEELKNHPRFSELEWALKILQSLASKMRKEREKNGAIGFETDEVRFRLALDGTPLEAYVKERKEAHLLIEDFMLLANKEVALYMQPPLKARKEDTPESVARGSAIVPFIFRVHDLPDMSKIADFARFALELGIQMKVDTPKQIAQSFNELMKKARTDDRLKVLEPLAIRCMAKAVYSSNNIGHYGLGFTHYAHFTSPIRRYSDVLAHRILERNLDGKTYRMDASKLEEQCKHISNQERKAAEAERESTKYKQAEFMSTRIGESFEGIISGMIERGFFVELTGSKAEGLVDFKYLDDTYTLEEGNLRATGRRYKKSFKMGDRVQVKIAAVDLAKRQVEMELAEM
ncbi:MAG: ribonuclease R [Saprospiraceae bacterium]|nr:ribonuclease R [Saprospiraceae bacterium]